MLRTADAAAEIGSWAMCAVAAHDAVRYGASDAAACLVARAAARVQGRMLALLAEHADARAGQDASRLDQVSSEFETAGTSLLAAEAAYAAGAAHRRGGDRGLAAVSLARGIALHARGEGARIPWVTPPGTACSPRASSRVAVLAAAGRTDAQIAAELGISGRTVSTHLTNVYAKLGVGSRHHLSETL